MLNRVRSACTTCTRHARAFTSRYRDFLLDPGTLFTLASLLLLVAAGIHSPGGLFGSEGPADAGTLLYLAAALVGSIYIWWSALQSMRRGDFTADIPVSLATLAALVIGQYSAAAVVAVLLLLGGLLEGLVAARAGKGLNALATLLPDRVTVRRGGGDHAVPLGELQVGDLLLVRSGERIAVDGEVVAGQATVNQAAITGESVPVERGPGDTVFAGTLNDVGAIEVRATRVGEETTLGQIRRMVSEAQTRRAPIERLLNRYAKFYTPAALLLGALLWWWTGDVVRAITVVIVFCPCVMVLATPTALVASIGNAALQGSLIKQGASVEALAKVDTVAFDKTGTLTKGMPQLVAVVPLNGWGEGDLLRRAAMAEKLSEHPLGRAVVRGAEARGLLIQDPDAFAVLPGLGVRAQTEGHPLLLGRQQWLADQGVRMHPEVGVQVSSLMVRGRTAILVASGQEIAGILVFEDVLRPEARSAVKGLARLGVRTVLITGDQRSTAEGVAADLGIDEFHAEVLPQQKVEIIQRLQAEGCHVAFVGDGVNDGPALAVAQVGVAMGLAGTDVALETAAVALLSDDLAGLPHLLVLSRRAIRVIRQNLVFSLGVLGAAIGLTALGVLTPVTGALLHELSSLPVIANSARLIGVREATDRTRTSN